MTRFAILGGFLLALCAPTLLADDKKDVPKELAPFQGTWKVAEAFVGGKPAPKDLGDLLRFNFDGEKLTITEKDTPETGSYKVDAKKDPTEIDLINSKGKTALGIYKFDKDGKMSICFIKGENATRPKGFDDKEAVLLVLEKVKK